jgi:hypothetical protein
MNILNNYLRSKSFFGNYIAKKLTNTKNNFNNTDTSENKIEIIITNIVSYIIILFAIYLAWRCDSGFWAYFFAIFFSEYYIVFKLGRDGMCGIFPKFASK